MASLLGERQYTLPDIPRCQVLGRAQGCWPGRQPSQPSHSVQSQLVGRGRRTTEAGHQHRAPESAANGPPGDAREPHAEQGPQLASR